MEKKLKRFLKLNIYRLKLNYLTRNMVRKAHFKNLKLLYLTTCIQKNLKKNINTFRFQTYVSAVFQQMLSSFLFLLL